MPCINLADVGTPRMPLRASYLTRLVRCPMSGIIAMMEDQGSGPAADTGSAIHAAAAAWHTVANKDTSAALRVMRAGLAKYPFADLDAAEGTFRYYAQDPRNQEARVILVEEKVEIRLQPAEDDPTQEEILIFGHVDQVREEDHGELAVVDIKTGKFHDGPSMLTEHCLQLSAYQLGASAKIGKPVRKARIIRTNDYLKRTPGPVFWSAAWRMSDCVALLDCVRNVVATLRRGQPYIVPTAEACRFCVGLSRCVPELQELKVKNGKAELSI